MLIREDLRPFNVMIHDPSKESFDILAGTFRDEEVEKNRDRSSLKNFAIWFFKNSTNKPLSLSFSLLKVYREIGWIVKVHWNAARVPRKCSQGSRE